MNQSNKESEQMKPTLWEKLKAKNPNDDNLSSTLNEVIGTSYRRIPPSVVAMILQSFPEDWKASKSLSPEDKKKIAEIEQGANILGSTETLVEAVINAAKEILKRSS